MLLVEDLSVKKKKQQPEHSLHEWWGKKLPHSVSTLDLRLSTGQRLGYATHADLMREAKRLLGPSAQLAQFSTAYWT
jgi:hypothetical protein